MKGEDISELLEELQAVRGETRVKTKEASIRSRFLQAACDEIFSDHDWLFNRRTAILDPETTDVDDGNGGMIAQATGRYKLPSDFSLANDYWVGTKDKSVVSQLKESMTVDSEGGNMFITFASTPQHQFIYHILAPDLLTDTQAKVYFPQHILIAERAYVRLKTAYFPDEESDKEYARNRRALRELYVKMAPQQSFSTQRWG